MNARPGAAGRSHSSTGTSALELALLGPLEARLDGKSLPLGGAKPRSLLAVLALNLGTAVSADRLVEELWSEGAPPTARHMVAVYVSRLRKDLGAGVVVTARTGYELGIHPEQIDLVRFERLLGDGREALASGDPSSAATSLSAGLALWRGPPLADFAYEPFAQADIARLEELRLQGEEDHVEAQLALGADLVADLEALVTAAPLRERRRAQQMLALYRAGRQADALAVYRDARRILLKDLGIEPSPALRELQRRILAQDDGLLADTPRRGSVPRESRRLVTVVVAELAAPPAYVEDPEANRSAVRAGLERARSTAERYGGTADELPDGDILAVFGCPRVHEDDCVRALLAAGDLRDEGVVARAGVETGEIIAAVDAPVRGSVVRRASRLKESARLGEVLAGPAVGDGVGRAAHLEPAAPKQPTALRLVEVLPNAPVRPVRLDAPFIGRRSELSRLRRLFRRVVADGTPVVATVVGEPGIGKSRLATELASLLLAEAQVLRGQCVAYGDGMTYWPLRQILSAAVGSLDEDEIVDLLGGDPTMGQMTGRIVALIRDSGLDPSVQEIRWAVRRLLARLARDRPLLVVVDDVHWAEQPFLDLIEHVGGVDSWAPMLLLCLARPEFLDDRPGWPTVTLVMDALTPAESTELAEQLLPAGDGVGVRDQIVEAASGNPLFLEQLAAFKVERPGSLRDGFAPASLQSLLAARLDLLGPTERAVLERAAVVGRQFWTDPVGELLPPPGRITVERHLQALDRKGLIQPDGSSIPFRTAFRFRHALIQEAAYRSLPKAERADLHEAVADWMMRTQDDSLDTDQRVGFHLEQAYAYRAELGQPDEVLRKLGARAGERLVEAGMRALELENAPAASSLLGRAVALLPDLRERLRPSLLLAEALWAAGAFEQGYSLLGKTIEEARSVGDVHAEWQAITLRARLGTRVAPLEWTEVRLASVAGRALQIFEALDDDVGLAHGLLLAVFPPFYRCHFDDAADLCRRALAHAKRSGDERLILLAHDWLHGALYFGSAHVDVVEAESEALLELAKGRPAKTAAVLLGTAGIEAMRGRADEARRRYLEAKGLAVELGLADLQAIAALFSDEVGLLFGDAEFTERETRAAYDLLEAVGESGVRCELAVLLAEALYQLGRHQEAAAFVKVGTSITGADDLSPQTRGLAVRAKLLAVDGKLDEARALAQEAVATASGTDSLSLRAFTLTSLTDVLLRAGLRDDAAAALREARTVSKWKGDIVTARRANARLAEL